jgi:hypothetical protein
MNGQTRRRVVPDRRNTQHHIWVQGELNRTRLQSSVAHCLLAVFTLNTIAALAMIFLVGFGRMVLSESLIMTLLAETVGQAAAIFYIVAKSLFRPTPHPQVVFRRREPGLSERVRSSEGQCARTRLP